MVSERDMTARRGATAPVRVDVAIVGAGMSGLLAARTLVTSGRSVVVIDKGRGVGGRLATRRIDGARLDHGAQFFTARTDRFQTFVTAMIGEGVVHEWTRGFGAESDGHLRYAVRGGMTALAKHLAEGLEVVTSCRIESVEPDGTVRADDGRSWRGQHVVVTSPVPQTIELLGDAAPAALHHVEYSPTLCLLALLDRAEVLGPSGALQRPPGTPFEFVADNAARGTSDVPALTAHLTGSESARRWDDPDETTLAAMIESVAPLLDGAAVVRPQLKRWRYATPTVLHADPCLVDGRLVFAGDAFGSPRVEGAATSGWAAARAVLDRLG